MTRPVSRCRKRRSPSRRSPKFALRRGPRTPRHLCRPRRPRLRRDRPRRCLLIATSCNSRSAVRRSRSCAWPRICWPTPFPRVTTRPFSTAPSRCSWRIWPGRSSRRRPRPDRRGGGKPHTRHIASAVKRTVWTRDLGRCAFVAKTGHRCDERRFVEFHHVDPYALGGEASVDLISLRCRRHNDYEGRLYFGQRSPNSFQNQSKSAAAVLE
jgi:hypothetical protein